VHQQPVTDKPLVDKDIDGIAIEFLEFRLGIEAAESQRSGNASWFVGVLFPRRRFRQTGALERYFSGDGQELREVSLPKIW